MSPGESLGAAFTVRLPLTASHRPSDPGRRHPLVSGAVTPEFHSTDLSGVRILVVDDRADARELIRRVLSECNAELLASGSAEEAPVLIEKTPEIDDACLEGELAGGKKGRGSRNKVPIVAAVQTTPGEGPSDRGLPAPAAPYC